MFKKHFCLVFLISGWVYSQSDCRTGKLYESFDFGDGKEQVALPLLYEFSGDTIFIHNKVPSPKRGDFAKMLVVKKQCDWVDTRNGKSFYLAKVFTGPGTLGDIPSRLDVEMEDGKGVIKLKHYQMPELQFSAVVIAAE